MSEKIIEAATLLEMKKLSQTVFYNEGESEPQNGKFVFDASPDDKNIYKITAEVISDKKNKFIVKFGEKVFIDEGRLSNASFRRKICLAFGEDRLGDCLIKIESKLQEIRQRQPAQEEEIEDAPREAENKNFDMEKIKARAKNILDGTDPEHKDPVKFVQDIYNIQHVGDESTGRVFMVSVGAQSGENSAGIQPKLSGGSGKGKSHACKAFLFLIPAKWKRETTLSNKAIFYMNLQAGEIIFSDDISLNEELEGVVKRATTNFQEETIYTTIDANREVMTLSIPPRITWWLTSVEDVQSLQMINRQYGENINETPEQDKLVHNFQAIKAVAGEKDFELTEDVLVCREIIDQIKSQLVPVIVQFADKLTWNDTANRRNFPIFLDMIKAFAVWRFKQRLFDGKRLVADIQDYEDAKLLYCGRAENQGTKLNDIELKCCRAIMEVGEIETKQLQKKLGISQGRLHVLIHGRKDRPESGLVNKVRGLTYETRNEAVNDTTRTNRNYYSLSGFSPIDAFKSVVEFPEEAKKTFKQYKNNLAAQKDSGDNGSKKMKTATNNPKTLIYKRILLLPTLPIMRK